MIENSLISGRYEALKSDRENFLSRARLAAKLTIPSIMPETGHSNYHQLYTPHQGVGARGVNNVSSKLLLSLFQPNTPFFKFSIDDIKLREIAEVSGTPFEQVRTQFDAALSQIEQAIMREFETTNMRVDLFEALKHLVVTGNVLIYLPDEGGARVFHLDQFCVCRDPMGNVVEILTEEAIAPAALPEDMMIYVGGSQDPDRSVKINTRIKRLDKSTWEIAQEVNGFLHSVDNYSDDAMPYIALRMSKIANENYGRGLVDEYIGDLQALEVLSKALEEGAGAMARLIIGVLPGAANIKDLNDAAQGQFVSVNNLDGIKALQFEKTIDFAVVERYMQRLEERLGASFLLNTSVTRQAERVTAEEIRFVAQELENILGGVYSVLGTELQLPLVKRIMSVMKKQKRLPKMPKNGDLVRPKVVTGVDALGRGHDVNKLQLFMRLAYEYGGPESLRFINVSELLTRLETGTGLEPGLVKSAEQVAQEAQQAQAQALAEKAIGPAAKPIADAAAAAATGQQ